MCTASRIVWVPLSKINVIADLKITEPYFKRMHKSKSILLPYDKLLAVEEVSEGSYILVGGYDRYQFMIANNETHAPCIIETLSYGSQCGVKVLGRLINSGDSYHKDNKQAIISKLGVEEADILKYTHLTKSDLRDFRFDDNISRKYINEHASKKTMNCVNALPLNQKVKDFLFSRASLPIGNSARLTQQSLGIIKHFLKYEHRFNELSNSEQIAVLTCAIRYRGEVFNSLKRIVDEYMGSQTVGSSFFYNDGQSYHNSSSRENKNIQ